MDFIVFRILLFLLGVLLSFLCQRFVALCPRFLRWRREGEGCWEA